MAFGILLAQLERNGCCMKFYAGQLLTAYPNGNGEFIG